jgi:16S rRNA (adenine1518-N6/adenine1519-N6)-dimethyltransferase
LFKVGKNAFDPPPKVTSGVIRLKRKENIRDDYNASLFKHIVKTSFNQRRKMLRNTLKSLIEKTNYNNDELLMKRPEQLGVDEFIELTKHLDHESGD